MVELLRFVGRAFRLGGQWANDVLGVTGAVILVLTLTIGLAVTGGYFRVLPVWVIVLIVAAVMFIIFAMGAYRQWQQERRRADAATLELDALRAEPHPMRGPQFIDCTAEGNLGGAYLFSPGSDPQVMGSTARDNFGPGFMVGGEPSIEAEKDETS